MEVMIRSPAGNEFNFDSTCTTPYVSAPSSPSRLGNYYFSAPTSPSRASTFYRDHFNDFDITGPSSTIPFNWEETPGTPKSKDTTTNYDDTDFAFDFSGQLDRPSLSADELFDGGKIKPLKPPPSMYNSETPKSPKNRPPRQKGKDFDPFAAAMEETRKELGDQRGREKTYDSSKSNGKRKGLRSLSPLRSSHYEGRSDHRQNSNPTGSVNSSSGSTWYSKWKLKDLLLFRSGSEGHKEKYAMLKKSYNEDVKNSSFRSTDSGGGSVSSRRVKGQVSAHEWHYTVNRAAAEELRRKTFLPYKRGLLGCLGFHIPGARQLSKGIGSRE